MSQSNQRPRISRREFLRLSALVSGGVFVASCAPKAGPQGIVPTQMPGGDPSTVATANANDRDAAIRKEGKIVSYGLPDYWADWKTSWEKFTGKYNLQHEDIDISSAEELQRFEAEKANPYGDVGDVGITWGPIGKEKGILAAYKHPWWDEIPDYFKDADGYWCVWYYGALGFAVRPDLVQNVPASFADLLKPEYKNKVAISDPRQAAMGLYGVLAAAYANGGDEKNIQPGIDFFAKLQKAGNLSPADANTQSLQSGEAAVTVRWDYLALADRDTLAQDGTKVVAVIPSDGSVAGPYASIINATAPHPNAARGWVDYIFSDEGQIDRARGYARPVRKVTIPDDIAATLIPDDQYKSVNYIKDYAAFDTSSATVKDKWGTDVLGQ
jgi:putative spermidine/putrescine transport system substrate-binding protein